MTGPATDRPSLLVTIAGPDRIGISARVLGALGSLRAALLDVEQLMVHGRLFLCIEVGLPDAAQLDAVATLRHAVEAALGDDAADLHVSVAALSSAADGEVRPRHLVTVLAPVLEPAVMAGISGRIADCGGNVERIVRLAVYPVTSYELEVSGADGTHLRRLLAAEAAREQVDVAVQQAGLHRRAKHLVVLDADSTLLQGEVIDLLAQRAGCAEEVASLTAAAMAGELDFTQALERRVALLAGLEESEVERLADGLVLAPGARTLVRVLRRLGYLTAVVSGGFLQVIEPLAAELGIDYVAANRLEVRDGRLTGRVEGPVVDRAGKAAALCRFAQRARVPLAQTVAVGDGANDLDMLAVAGLGIAFNAKPVVRDAADTTLNVPYLDAILFLLGISRAEVEAADRC